jgi:predicted esterase
MCGWLPFANKIEDLQLPEDAAGRKLDLMIPKLLLDIIGCKEIQANTSAIETMLSTPVLLLHGTDDAWIDVGLGRQAYRTLTNAGMHVDWKEYSGAENEGHWIREPEGFDAIVTFLEATFLG